MWRAIQIDENSLGPTIPTSPEDLNNSGFDYFRLRTGWRMPSP